MTTRTIDSALEEIPEETIDSNSDYWMNVVDAIYFDDVPDRNMYSLLAEHRCLCKGAASNMCAPCIAREKSLKLDAL